MVAAMAVEMIIRPARGTADRRAPIRLAENAADRGACDGANRTGNDETGARTGRGADPIGADAWRSHRHGGPEEGRSQ